MKDYTITWDPDPLSPPEPLPECPAGWGTSTAFEYGNSGPELTIWGPGGQSARFWEDADEQASNLGPGYGEVHFPDTDDGENEEEALAEYGRALFTAMAVPAHRAACQILEAISADLLASVLPSAPVSVKARVSEKDWAF